eukprot:CAMPEP_0194137462 /NCGR_PEP_ID=MMETSP0152-20130528/7355_1 /TAXON_ID=1049557 /ORGANISM="Thalassiothrix antarctica, Strain L6-D1" /LENGTH=353 /DNA_ID=CAMNT_0038834493 /DNA_START=30 /DNA_END=1088 /DNA_ORIENTATION=-
MAKIVSFTLKGHKSSVNCLSYQNETSLLLSGSDDTTARLWDLRTSKASLCIRTDSPVTSVAFGKGPSKEEIVLSGPFAKNSSVFLGMEDDRILEYDLRQAGKPIVTEPTRDLTELFELDEEVNQISFSKNRIIAADDGGAVRLFSNDGGLTVLRDNSAPPFLMTCCSFRRTSDQLASGGTDCTLYYWDIRKPRKPLDSMCIPRDDDSAAVNQVCNPPMVHTLAWSPSGRLLASGLGDGTIEVVSIAKNKKFVHQSRLRNGHSNSVASLCFPNFGCGKRKSPDDRLLASIGTDGVIFLWDLNPTIGGRDATDPAKILSKKLLELEEGKDGEFKDSNKKDPKILFGIPHQAKGNW